MSENCSKKWYIIVNPHAGSGKTISKWKKAEKCFREKGLDYVSVETCGPGHAEELAAAALDEGYRNLAAVGGDGTVHELFCGLMHWYESRPAGSVHLQDIAIAVIPIGSGNDWIKTHKVPRDIDRVADLMKSSSFHLQDVVRVSRVETRDPREAAVAPAIRTDYMLNVAGVGFDSRICAIVNEQKRLGKTGSSLYLKALLKVIANFYSFPIEIWADGKLFFSGDCFSIAFGTGQYSGGGMRQVPDAVVDDLKLDMMVVPRLPIPLLLSKLRHLFTGRLSSVKELLFAKCSSIVVLPAAQEQNPEVVEIDGETIGPVPVRMEVLPEQIRVLSCLE